jgi:hypothetical protein
VDSSSRFGHAQDAAKSLVALRAAVAIAVYHGGRKANRVEVPCDYRQMNVRSGKRRSRTSGIRRELRRSRPAERLIRDGRLHVGLRDFDDDVSIVVDQKPRQIVSKVSRSNRLELDVNFEDRTVLTHKSAAP